MLAARATELVENPVFQAKLVLIALAGANALLFHKRDGLERHADDYKRRAGFTYTVLAPDRDDVIGCVYIYPSRDERFDADVRSWVRADRAELDVALHATVSRWLAENWPFAAVDYADRGQAS